MSRSGLSVGDMVQLWDRVRGWKFNQFMMDTYGSVARLHGPFGVS
jgi:hypothetical protein